MLDWQGKLWVNFSEMPDLLERQGEPMVQLLATLVEQVAAAQAPLWRRVGRACQICQLKRRGAIH